MKKQKRKPKTMYYLLGFLVLLVLFKGVLMFQESQADDYDSYESVYEPVIETKEGNITQETILGDDLLINLLKDIPLIIGMVILLMVGQFISRFFSRGGLF